MMSHVVSDLYKNLHLSITLALGIDRGFVLHHFTENHESVQVSKSELMLKCF